jgi:hypothetical protein
MAAPQLRSEQSDCLATARMDVDAQKNRANKKELTIGAWEKRFRGETIHGRNYPRQKPTTIGACRNERQESADIDPTGRGVASEVNES